MRIHMKPCRYLYHATQMTKGMATITMAVLQCSLEATVIHIGLVPVSAHLEKNTFNSTVSI